MKEREERREKIGEDSKGLDKEKKREQERRDWEEQERRERRRRIVIWRGIGGDDAEERRVIVRNVIKEILERKAKFLLILERVGEGRNKVLIVEMEEEKDKRELLERESLKLEDGKLVWMRP